MKRVGLPIGIYEPEELINEAWTTVKWKNVSIDDAKWAGYWYSILRNTALHMKKPKTAGWKPTDSRDEDEGERKSSLLEELSDDRGKSPERIWESIEEQLAMEEWSQSVEEHLQPIVEEEILQISSDPYFKQFMDLVWREGFKYREAYRAVAEAAARRGEKPSKSRSQFIKYIDKFVSNVRERWRSLNLPMPKNLPRDDKVDNVNHYYLRWIINEEPNSRREEEDI